MILCKMKTKMVLLILIAVLVQACSNSGTMNGRGTNTANSRSGNGAVNGGGGGAGSVPVRQASCTGDTFGWISANGAGNFAQAIEDFVSVDLPPGDMGTVSLDYGIQVQFEAIFSIQGQLLSRDAFVQILINDSKVGEIDVATGKPIPPYEVTIYQATSGSFNPSTGRYTIVFEDEFGSITVEGNNQGQDFVGTVKFQNKVAFDGGAGRGGTLGSIRVPKCSLVIQ